MQIMQMGNSTLLKVGVTWVSNPPDGGDRARRDSIILILFTLLAPADESSGIPSGSRWCALVSAYENCRASSKERLRESNPCSFSLVSLPASLFLSHSGVGSEHGPLIRRLLTTILECSWTHHGLRLFAHGGKCLMRQILALSSISRSHHKASLLHAHFQPSLNILSSHDLARAKSKSLLQ